MCHSVFQGMTVEPAARLLMRRPNTLVLRDTHLSELYLAFESREEREGWMTTFLQALLDLKVWRLSCDFIIPRPGSKFYVNSPSSSLFKEVPKVMDAESISLFKDAPKAMDTESIPLFRDVPKAMDTENVPHRSSKFYVDFPSLVNDTPKAARKEKGSQAPSMTQL